MTKQLTQFASFNIVLALVYFFFMKEVITNNDTAAIAVTTIIFTTMLSTSERYFLQRDNQRAVRFSLPLAYSIVSIILASIVTAAWAFSAHVDAGVFLLVEAVIVAGAIGAAMVTDRGNIKGMSKKELFK